MNTMELEANDLFAALALALVYVLVRFGPHPNVWDELVPLDDEDEGER